MSEDEQTKNEVTTDQSVKKRRARFTVTGIFKRPRILIISTLIAILIISGGLVYWLLLREEVIITKVGDQTATRQGNTIEINGQKIDTSYYDSVKDNKISAEDASKNVDQIKELEEKIADDKADIQDVMILARLYEQAGDNDKAAGAYETAKKIADKDMDNYEDFIEYLDSEINRVKNN